MRDWTLRTRLALWSAVFFAGATALLGVLTLALVRQHQVASLDSLLADEGRAIFHEIAEHGPAGAGHVLLVVEKGTRAVILEPDGTLLWSSPELAGEIFPHAGVGAGTFGEWRVLGAVENGRMVRVARGFDEVNATVADVRRAYLFALPVLLLLVGGGAWWLVRSALRPVQEISATARQITAEHLDARLPLPARRDELGQLTSVLNEMLVRLDRGHAQAMRFTADASHELNTPLALVAAGLEELLRRRDLPPDVVGALGSLLDENRRLAAVCQDLLVLARADAGGLVLDRQPHDLRLLVEAAVEDARILGEERSIAVDLALPPHADESVDARYFTRILLNLLSNAVKYNRHGGRVRVDLIAEAERWVLTVGNTGPEIAPEHQARLFERFFRADNSAATQGHGLGLGLSRELARAHGGDLTLSSSSEEWTVFQLTIPRAFAEPEGTPSLSPGPSRRVAHASFPSLL